MKKILAIALSVVMLLSLSVVFASAAPGFYCGGSEDAFASIGGITIEWAPDASEKLDLSDGDMNDWVEAGYGTTSIGPNNMISWVGGTADNQAGGVPDGWGIQAYFVADKDYLYIGFYVTDPTFAASDNPAGYNGDAFQFSVDFDRALGKAIEADPDLFAANSQCIFYSFSPLGADPTPIQVMIQHNDDDGVITEESEDEDLPGITLVKGTTAKTDAGWCAEFALSWDKLYHDFAWRGYADGYVCDVWEGDPLEVNCGLYYLDRDTTGGNVLWAAGTLKNQEAGVAPEVTWAPADNGMYLYLEYSPELEFSCPNIHVLDIGETPAPETEPPETEAPTKAPETEAPTEEPTEVPTAAPETEAPTQAPAGNDDNNAGDKSEGGCGGVIGFGSVAIILSAAAAAVVLKKKD